MGGMTPTLREWRWNEGTQGWDILDYGKVVGFMSLEMQRFLVKQSQRREVRRHDDTQARRYPHCTDRH